MIELREKEAEIDSQLRSLERLLEQATHGEAQMRAARQAVEILRDDVEYFELTLEHEGAAENEALAARLNGFRSAVTAAEKRLAAQPSGFDPAAEIARINVYELGKLQLFDLGDGMLDRALAKLQRINCRIIADGAVVDTANATLSEQAEQLARADEHLHATRSVLSESGKLISQMVNSFYRDKFLLTLAALLLMLVIVVVVLGVVRRTKKPI